MPAAVDMPAPLHTTMLRNRPAARLSKKSSSVSRCRMWNNSGRLALDGCCAVAQRQSFRWCFLPLQCSAKARALCRSSEQTLQKCGGGVVVGSGLAIC
mmetsp:Transcript_4798/g.15620  ORF Transcript_4798/g.15620 Transcript_4798/m.15620 type:complete len:98 (-) Transcript_4798:47-340(-)